MTYQNIILGISIHALIWEHLPMWGTWFTRLLGRLPKPLQSLYEQWHCPYCAGFWIGISLHAATGNWTLPLLADMPAFWGPAGLPAAWFLDGLASAILIKTGVLMLNAVGLPAIKGYQLKTEFMKSRKTETQS